MQLYEVPLGNKVIFKEFFVCLFLLKVVLHSISAVLYSLEVKTCEGKLAERRCHQSTHEKKSVNVKGCVCVVLLIVLCVRSGKALARCHTRCVFFLE